MKIRKAKVSDAKGISKLTQETLDKINRKDYTAAQISVWKKGDTEEKVEERLNDKERDIFVVTKDKKILGFGSLKGNEITAIYVNASSIRKGVGSRILHHLERRALEKGIKKLRLDSSLTAFPFYNSHGYRKVKETCHHMEGGDIPCIVMEKELS